jgi:hypothetical protein
MKIGETRKGTRLYEMKDDWSDLVEGAYYKLPDGNWAICPPGGLFGTISSTVHTITEHEDGTITVSPSILYHPWQDGTHGWHGFLERGVWRRV